MIDFNKEVLDIKDDLLKDLKTLCQIPSVLDEDSADTNQPFGEANRKALDQMLAFGQRDGYLTDDCDGYAGHIDIGEGEKVFGVLGHLDVVPVNKTGCNYPPFDSTLDNDILYGRGVADDKGPLLAAYYASKIVDKLVPDKKYKIRVIFGCNEESGSACMKYYFKHRPFPEMGFTPDADFPVVYGEKAMCGFILNGQYHDETLISLHAGTQPNVVPGSAECVLKGDIKNYEESFETFLSQYDLKGSITQEENIKIEVFGKSAHGSTPELGINAVVYLCHYLHNVIDNEFVSAIDDLFFEDTEGKILGIDHIGQIGALTNNVGVVHYDNGQGEIMLDIRYSDEVVHEEMIEKVREKIAPYHLNETHHITDALYVDPESDLVITLHNAFVDITGDTSLKPQTMGGRTYAKEMPHCVAFGCEFPDRSNCMHQDNESIRLHDLLISCAIYAKALYDIVS